MRSIKKSWAAASVVAAMVGALLLAPVATGLPAGNVPAGSLPPQLPVKSYRDGPPPEGPPGELYMPNPGENQTRVYDTKTNELIKVIPSRDGASMPGVIAKTHDEKKLYVDDFGQDPATVTVIDRSKDDATKTIPVFSAPMGIFTSLDGTEIYVPEQGGMVEVIDVETDTVVRQLRFPDMPVGAIAGPDGLMYVGFMSGYISAVDPKTGEVVKPALHLGGIGAFWYSFSQDGQTMYADVINSLAIVDMKEWKVVKRLHTATDGQYYLDNPGAFISTLSPDGSRLYVSLWGRPNVLVLDTATDEFIYEIPTSGFQTGIEFSPDGSRGYISDVGPKSLPFPGPIGEIALFLKLTQVGHTGPSQIVVFDPETDDVLGTIPNGDHGAGVPAVLSPKKENW